MAPSFAGYAPWRFLAAELERKLAQAPRLLGQLVLPVRSPAGPIRLGAVARRMTLEVTTLDFVDGRDGLVLAHHQILGPGRDAATRELAELVLSRARDVYTSLERAAAARGGAALDEPEVLAGLRASVEASLALTDGDGVMVR
jgi:hypothetical protein